MTTTVNNYTSDATWTAPNYLLTTTAAGGGTVALKVFGAIGGDDNTTVHPTAEGGWVDGGLEVAPGDVITIKIGVNGSIGAKASGFAGIGGGGNGGDGLHQGGQGGDAGEYYGGVKGTGGYGGGGSTGVKLNGVDKIEAAGGGGIGGGGDPVGELFGYTNGGSGGVAGSLPRAGGDGITDQNPYSNVPGHGGQPPTAVAGGAGGISASALWATVASSPGSPGTGTAGGAGSNGDDGYNPGGGGGGGGGGKFGGGGGSGGGSNSGGGGGAGGISWVDTDVLNPQIYEGGSTLYGSVRLTFTVADAPLFPYLTEPTNGGFVDVDDITASTRLGFTYRPGTDSGVLNAYALRIKPVGGSYGYWNGVDFSDTSPVWMPCEPTTTFVDIPNTAFTPGTTYDWSFAHQESYYDLQGVFAMDSSFTAALSPTLVITAPVDIVDSTTPTVSWTGTFPAGNSQQAYRAVVYTPEQVAADGFTPGQAPYVLDTGLVSTGTPSFTLGALDNVDDYVLALYITDTPDNAPSPWVLQPFSVSSGGPATPTITATAAIDGTSGCPYIEIATTSSYGTDVYIEVEFSDDQVNWYRLRNTERLNTTTPVGDYETPFNSLRYYRARAVGNIDWSTPGAYSVWSSESVSAQVNSRVYWFVDPLNPGPDENGNLGAFFVWRTSSRKGSSASGIRLSHEVDRPEQQGEFQVFGQSSSYLVRGDMYDERFDLALLFDSLDKWEMFDAFRNRRRTICMRSDLPGKIHYMALGPGRPRDLYSAVDRNLPTSVSEVIIQCIPQKKP